MQNGAILTNSDRYTLMIDPQLQGITWIKQRYADANLQVTRLTNKKLIPTLEQSIEAGKPVLIENLENSIDAVIQPVYARAIIKKGKNSYIKMGDKELSLDPKFKLFLHTKLSNPHYPPEIQAECTLINFTVTEKGLEDQLLSLVVKKERPDLSALKEDLIQQQNNFKITLRDLEADLLQRLVNQQGDILEDIDLIENLERSKALSTDIKEKVENAKITSIAIDEASEQYRPAAERGALVYFMMIELTKIHSFYKFSLDSFINVINRAIDIVAARMNPKKPEPVEGEEPAQEEPEEKEMDPATLKLRVTNLIEQITFEGYDYTRRGTFEKHKLIIATMLCLRINKRKKLINDSEESALIKKEMPLEVENQPSSLMFMSELVWAAVCGLSQAVKTF
jgi:dynein heavy chain